MNLGDRDVSCANLFPTRIGQSDKRVESLFVDTVESSSVSASTISLGGTDLQTTLNSLAGGSLTADWNSITNKPSDEAFVDWTQDQGDTNINANNYINTTYSLASNGQAGLTNFNFTEARKNKLAAIADGAQVNVQSDWNETETNADAFIQNKPTIPSAITGTSDVPGLDTALASKMPKSGGTFTGEIVLDQASTHSHAFLSITKAGTTFMDVDTAGQFTFHRNLILNNPSEIRGIQYNTMTWKGDKDGLHVYQDGVLTFPSISDVEAAINLNSNKVGITQSEQDAIVVNSAKVSYPGPPSWSQVTNKPNLQLALDTPVVNSPSGSGNLTLTNNTLLTYTPPDLSGFVETTGNETIAGVKTFSSDIEASSNVNVGALLKFDTGSGWGDLINMRGGAGSFGYQTMISHNYHSGTFRPKLEFKFGYVNHPNTGTSVAVGGFVTRNGFANASSDDRLKHDELNIANGLEVIRSLNPQYYRKTFDFQDSEEECVYEAGFIAQEVLETELAFAVSDGDYVNENGETVEEPYRLDYNSVFTYAVAAVKELDAVVQAQAATIASLETRLNRLTSMFDAFHE
jgi:hypothetical protein